LTFVNTPWRNSWYFVPVSAAFVVASLALVIGSWRLHRRIEIRP
jgi:hypothetical protein